ncbi:MAG: hypothetical protein MSG64_06930 [Pyrinomonadaceae bacterium MAG19_C2-C3]|nr:hypothetical protein [Pyrinomonadaceae bacterium MAG19_C2-C3]
MSQVTVANISGRVKTRVAVIAMIFAVTFLTAGCGLVPGVRSKVTVPQLLTPLQTADTARLINEVNKTATVQSVRGKIDIQFLDTSFAKCGVAEKYRTADGTVVLQRPGQVNLRIQIPFVGTDVAQMTSDGSQFRIAVLLGEERFRRFVRGTNDAIYPPLEMNADGDCGDDNKKERAASQQRAVGALSSLRPQHFTDALLVRPVAQNGGYIYVRSEYSQDEIDERPAAERKEKKGGRVVRGYYLLDELMPLSATNGEANNGGTAKEARLVRRFWFDRYQGIRLARLQTFDPQGQVLTDVLYKKPRPFGGGALNQPNGNLAANAQAFSQGGAAASGIMLPSTIELTRPQERYAIRITYQSPEAVTINRPYDAKVFLLENEWSLPEVDLDRGRVTGNRGQK